MSSDKVQAPPNILAGARTSLGLTQAELATAAGVGVTTLIKLEQGRTKTYQDTRERVQQALELRGIVFTNGGTPGFKIDKSKAVIT